MCVLVVTFTTSNQDSINQDSISDRRHIEDRRSIQGGYVPKEVRLLKSDVIDNIECRLTVGRGKAQGLAVVSIPRGEATDFAVLDSSGARFSGSLPFNPSWTRVGVNPEGSTVVGFAEFRGGGGGFKPPDAPEPIRILRDNETIFESEKIWDFDVAADASSFIVHEPVPDGTSRLIVRNLNTNNEVHHDLGTRFTPVDADERDYILKYSLDFKEAAFIPVHADARGQGRHWFYPIDEGKPRRLTIRNFVSASFANSTEWYFVEYPEQSTLKQERVLWTVHRKELNPTRNEEKVIWRRTIELERFIGIMELSGNGKWLRLAARNYTVLNAETGKTHLQFKVADDYNRQFERLRTVLSDDATASDIGTFGGASFFGDLLISYRFFGTTAACATKPGETYDAVMYRKCMREQRRTMKLRQYYDVFDLNEVSVDGSPIFRWEIFGDTQCSEANSPMPGLIVDNGVLGFGVHKMWRGTQH